ncbi:MAG: hypothetical protein J6Y42_04355 [Bacilli bacterium]|nr:hypothetical protein [Bacilli bacterium]
MDVIRIQDKKNTLMVAHRGLSGLERENTIRSFTAACNRSFYGSECDIHLTKDKKFVICHDDHIARVSNYDVKIKDVTLKALRKYRLKEFNQDYDGADLLVPTLDEYLDLHKKYNKHCIIEIKCEIKPKDVKYLLDRIKDMYDLIIFIGFDMNNLIKIRKQDKTIPIEFLSSHYDESYIKDLVKYNFGLDIYYKELTKERIEYLHNKGIIVNAWTVNDYNDALNLIDWGIDFITTNILE